MTASISPLVPRPALLTSALSPAFAIKRTAYISPSLTAANPASITSTPSSSSLWAMRNLFSGTRDTPGVCSPSRRVVSKNFTDLGKRLNKAIPHLRSLLSFTVEGGYKNYGAQIAVNCQLNVTLSRFFGLRFRLRLWRLRLRFWFRLRIGLGRVRGRWLLKLGHFITLKRHWLQPFCLLCFLDFGWNP